MPSRVNYGNDVNGFLDWLEAECGRATKSPVYRLYLQEDKTIVARPLLATDTYDFGVVGPVTKPDITRIKDFADEHEIPTQKIKKYEWNLTQSPTS